MPRTIDSPARRACHVAAFFRRSELSLQLPDPLRTGVVSSESGDAVPERPARNAALDARPERGRPSRDDDVTALYTTVAHQPARV